MDEFFSADRLRKYWKSPAPAKEEPREKGEDGLEGALESLRRSISERFSGDELFALGVLVDALASLLERLGSPDSPADEIVPAVHETLNQIEDLLESFEVRDRTGPASL